MTEPKGKAPRWICRDKKDQLRLEAWTNAKLDEMEAERVALEAKLDARLEEMYDPARDPLHIFDPSFAAAVEKDFSERLKRGRVIIAALDGDQETYDRLADTEELRLAAARASRVKRGRGRLRGEPRPRDLSRKTRSDCEKALADLKRIRQIWKTEYGYVNRPKDMGPSAIGIAARRWGFKDDDALINFKKNRHRFLRLKSSV